MERRLAAILAADVAGYSRLMGTDEVGTLKAHRRERVDRAIARHNGRIVKTTGDGLLVEFASVVDAVGCAVAIQRAMLAFNAGIHVDRQVVFRIGIRWRIARCTAHQARTRPPDGLRHSRHRRRCHRRRG